MFPANRGGTTWVLLAVLLTSATSAFADSLLLCHHASCKYVGYSDSDNTHEYLLEGNTIKLQYTYRGSITVECNGFSALDSPALPKSNSTLRITDVILKKCPPPVTRSFKDVFAAINFDLVCEPGVYKPAGSILLQELPASPPLAVRHFHGLESLAVLRITTEKDVRVSPKPGFLVPLGNLTFLILHNVALSEDELNVQLPLVRKLQLYFTGVDRLSQSLLSSTSLRQLAIASVNPLNMAVPMGLFDLELDSPATTFQLDSVSSLRTLVLSNWVELSPALLTRCDKLTALLLKSPAVKALPDGWVAECSQLKRLGLKGATSLTVLPPTLLKGASALTHISFVDGALEALPAKLLDYSPNLREINLAGNRLRSLPSGLFVATQRVRGVVLSHNDLASDVFQVLAQIKDVSALNLAHNPRISDVCDSNRESPLNKSLQLVELILSYTNISRVCFDWRGLEILDLTGTPSQYGRSAQ